MSGARKWIRYLMMGWGMMALWGATGWSQEKGASPWGENLAARIAPRLNGEIEDPGRLRSHLQRVQKYLVTYPEKPLGNLANLLNSTPDRRYPTKSEEPQIYEMGLVLCGFYEVRRGENPDFASDERNQVGRIAQFFHFAADALHSNPPLRESLIRRLPQEVVFKVIGFNRPLFTSSFFLLFGQIQGPNQSSSPSVYQRMKDLEQGGVLDQDEVKMFLVRCSSFLQVPCLPSSFEERTQLLGDLLQAADDDTSVLLGLGLERLLTQAPAEEKEALRQVLEGFRDKGRYPSIVAECTLRFFFESDPELEQRKQLPARFREKPCLSSVWFFDPEGADASATVEYLKGLGWAETTLELGLMKGSVWEMRPVVGFFKWVNTRRLEITLLDNRQIDRTRLALYDIVCLRGHSFQTSVMMRHLQRLSDQLVINGGCGSYQTLNQLLERHPQALYIGSGIPTSQVGNNFLMAHIPEVIARSNPPTWREMKEGVLEACAGDPEMERIIENFLAPGTLPMLIYDCQLARTQRRPGFLRVSREGMERYAQAPDRGNEGGLPWSPFPL